jgi:hypothetical protein
MLFDMIERECLFARNFFKIRPEDVKAYLKEIFVRPTASFQQKMQEKLVVAANVSELMQLYGRICEMGARTGENAYLAGVFKMYKSFMCTRIEVLLISQVKSLDAAISQESSQTNISLVTRRFAEILVRIVASAGNSIDSIELKDRYFGR